MATGVSHICYVVLLDWQQAPISCSHVLNMQAPTPSLEELTLNLKRLDWCQGSKGMEGSAEAASGMRDALRLILSWITHIS